MERANRSILTKVTDPKLARNAPLLVKLAAHATNTRRNTRRKRTLPAISNVFIHPFEDGNGRLHRFLIHDLLHRGDFMAPGVMLPVSATMLRKMHDYDAALESYSRPLLDGWLAYELNEAGELTITNPKTVESYYRYPDLTAQAAYLINTVTTSIREDLAEELRFLLGSDAARDAARAVVDLPDRRLDLLLRLLHQNGGTLSRSKRELFAELTDEEVARIESGFVESFRTARAEI